MWTPLFIVDRCPGRCERKTQKLTYRDAKQPLGISPVDLVLVLWRNFHLLYCLDFPSQSFHRTFPAERVVCGKDKMIRAEKIIAAHECGYVPLKHSVGVEFS